MDGLTVNSIGVSLSFVQVLQQDIRGVHQGRGKAAGSAEEKSAAAAAATAAAAAASLPPPPYLCRLDNLEIRFVTSAAGIEVISAALSSS